MRNQSLRTKLMSIPIFAILLLMIIPASNFDAFATDSPLSFGAITQLNTNSLSAMDDVEGSEQDGVHWIWHQDTSGNGLYYNRSNDGEVNTEILIRGLDHPSDIIADDADLLVDGTDVYIFYLYINSQIGFLQTTFVKKSTDGGATFGAEVQVTNNGEGNGRNTDTNFGERGVVAQDRTNGDLYFFQKCECTSDESTIGVVRSTDGGATWTEVTDVAGMEYTTHQWYDPFFDEDGIYIDDGVIQITFEALDDNFGDYFVMYNTSVDKGDTWEFGALGEDGLELVPLGFDDESSDDVPNILVAGSQTLVVWKVDFDTIYLNRSSDLGQSWETTNNPDSIPTVCSNPNYDGYALGQIGSFVGFMCTDTKQDDTNVFFMNSPDLGATWSSERLVLADDAGQTGDNFSAVNVDVNGNNMAFTFFSEVNGSFETYIFYAQDPDANNDFFLQEIIEVNGIAMGETDQNAHLPMVCMSDDKVYFTYLEDVTKNFKWTFATLTNSGIIAPDTTPPVITAVFPPEPQSLSRDVPFIPLNYATAFDDVDGDLTSSIMVEVNGVDITQTGIYTVTYEVVDMAMNIATTDIQFFVKKPSTGIFSGSTSGGSQGTGGSDFVEGQSTIPKLEDIPEPSVADIQPATSTPLLQFGDDGIETVSGLSISDIFANLFGNRLGADTGATVIDPPTVATSQPSGFGEPSTTGTSSQAGISIVNVISDFFRNLFG